MKKETKEKVYLVCNSSSEIAPRHVLRIYKSKAAAYNFLGRYVAELEKSTFTGTVNITENAEGGTAVSDNAVITIESGSTWILTGDCTISSLNNNGTIRFNGHTITLADGTVLK